MVGFVLTTLTLTPSLDLGLVAEVKDYTLEVSLTQKSAAAVGRRLDCLGWAISFNPRVVSC